MADDVVPDRLATELRLLADVHAFGAVRAAMLRAADEIERLRAHVGHLQAQLNVSRSLTKKAIGGHD